MSEQKTTGPLHCKTCELVHNDTRAIRRLLEGYIDDEGQRRPGVIEKHEARLAALEKEVEELRSTKAWWKLTITDLAKIVIAAALGSYFSHHIPRN